MSKKEEEYKHVSVGTTFYFSQPHGTEGQTMAEVGGASGPGALRYNEGKPPIHMVPVQAIMALAQLFAAGAKKYAPFNWAKGMAWSKCYDSLQRHAMKWSEGQDFDEETQAHHMIAVAWNAIVLYCYHLWGRGQDDRFIAPTRSFQERIEQ